ncbi:hypothetical protein ABVT39_019932 [Epinephelus coioides]
MPRQLGVLGLLHFHMTFRAKNSAVTFSGFPVGRLHSQLGGLQERFTLTCHFGESVCDNSNRYEHCIIIKHILQTAAPWINFLMSLS